MFIEGKRHFLRAKRELAQEIDTLIQNTPTASLCIAVNDALGRNNVGMDVLEKLQAYSRTARKMAAAVRSRAENALISPEDALDDAASKVSRWHESQAAQDLVKTAAYAAELLRQPARLIAEEDVEYLLECWRHRHEEYTSISDCVGEFADGADGAARPSSVLDQVLGDRGIHLQYAALRQLADTMRTGPLLTERELRKVQDYAARHLKDVETMRGLGRRSTVPEPVQKLQLSALQTLGKLAGQHLSLLDHKAFFTAQELARAARFLIPPNDLQAVLDRLNSLAAENTIRSLIASVSAEVKRFQFPLDRYLEKRFRLPDAGT